MAGILQPAKHAAGRLVRFGAFELNLDTGELRRLGRLVNLQDQQTVVLKYLVARAGSTVSREELRTQIWPEGTYVEFETGLYNTINRLRRSLGDSASHPHFIETVPKEGYRFIAAVEHGSGKDSHASLLEDRPAESKQDSPGSFEQVRRRFPVAKWVRLSGLALAILLLGAFLGIAFWRRFVSRPPGDQVYRYFVQVSGVEQVQSLAISPLGDQIVFQGADGLLWRRYLDRRDPRPIRGSERGTAPFFSPDGQSVGFFSDSVLKIVEGEGARQLAVLPSGFPFCDAVWGPDGFIYFNTRIGKVQGIWRIRAQGSRCELVVPSVFPGSGPVHALVNQVIVRPRHLLIYSTNSGPLRRSVHVRDLETKLDKTIVARGVGGYLLPGGKLTFFNAGSLFAAGFDSQDLRIQGTPVEMVKDVDSYAWQSGRCSISNNGTLAYVAQPIPGPSILQWIDSSGRVTPLPLPADRYQQVEISPGGDLLAIVRGDGWNKGSLWTYGLRTGAWRHILDSDVPYLRAQWAPDETALVVSSARQNEDFTNLYRVSLADPANMQRLTQQPDYGQVPLSWSAKANAILFIEGIHEHSKGDVMVLPLGGKAKEKPLVSTAGWDRSASFSPNGQWFAYESEMHGQPEIFICRFNAATAEASANALRISDDGGRDPVWAPDGHSIYYADLSQRLMKVALSADMAPRERRRLDVVLPEMKDYWANRFSIAPDGRLLVVRLLKQPAQVAEIQVVVNWAADVKRLVPEP